MPVNISSRNLRIEKIKGERKEKKISIKKSRNIGPMLSRTASLRANSFGKIPISTL